MVTKSIWRHSATPSSSRSVWWPRRARIRQRLVGNDAVGTPADKQQLVCRRAAHRAVAPVLPAATTVHQEYGPRHTRLADEHRSGRLRPSPDARGVQQRRCAQTHTDASDRRPAPFARRSIWASATARSSSQSHANARISKPVADEVAFALADDEPALLQTLQVLGGVGQSSSAFPPRVHQQCAAPASASPAIRAGAHSPSLAQSAQRDDKVFPFVVV